MATKKAVKPATKKPATKKPVARKTTVKKTAPAKKSVTAVKSAPAPVGFNAALRTFFVKYFEFNGVATRAEYWWVRLFCFVIFVLFGLFVPWVMLQTGALPLGLLSAGLTLLFLVAIAIPSLAQMSRRVHDAGYSAWVFFLPLIIATVMEWFELWGAGLLSTVVGVWGLILTLIPSKTTGNPYRN